MEQSALQSLRPHHRLFIEAFAKGVPISQAAKAGGSRGKDTHSLTTVGCRWLRRDDVQQAFQELVSGRLSPGEVAGGLSDEDIWRKAVQVVFDCLNSEDESIQLRAVDLLAKIQGQYAPEKHQHALEVIPPKLEDPERVEAIKRISARQKMPSAAQETSSGPRTGVESPEPSASPVGS